MKMFLGLLCLAIVCDLAFDDPAHLRQGYLEVRQVAINVGFRLAHNEYVGALNSHLPKH